MLLADIPNSPRLVNDHVSLKRWNLGDDHGALSRIPSGLLFFGTALNEGSRGRNLFLRQCKPRERQPYPRHESVADLSKRVALVRWRGLPRLEEVVKDRRTVLHRCAQYPRLDVCQVKRTRGTVLQDRRLIGRQLL